MWGRLATCSRLLIGLPGARERRARDSSRLVGLRLRSSGGQPILAAAGLLPAGWSRLHVPDQHRSGDLWYRTRQPSSTDRALSRGGLRGTSGAPRVCGLRLLRTIQEDKTESEDSEGNFEDPQQDGLAQEFLLVDGRLHLFDARLAGIVFGVGLGGSLRDSGALDLDLVIGALHAIEDEFAFLLRPPLSNGFTLPPDAPRHYQPRRSGVQDLPGNDHWLDGRH